MKRTLFGLLLFLIAASAAAQNSAPAINAAAPVYLTAGGPPSNATIATVSDAEDAAGTLIVTADSTPSGISMNNITNSDGTVTATITVACDASAGANDVTLMVMDSTDAASYATFIVNVTIAAAPSTPAITAIENGTYTSDQACPEQPLTLTATATGATSYQWFNNNDTIDGATEATYSATGSGSYTVTASNDCATSAHSDPYIVQNPTPHKPFVTALGPTTVCGGTVTLWSDSATGIQWYRNGVAIAGAGSESYVATTSGSYTCVLNALGCHSTESDPIDVTISNSPSAPTITAGTNGTGTNDQACPAQPLTLVAHDTNSSLTNYQWFNNNDAITGATSNQYVATSAGDYTIVATSPEGCSTSSAAYVVQNPTMHTPVVTADGPTTVCGDSVMLEANAATGIQWYRDGVAIAGAGSQVYVATVSGDYTCTLNALGCMTSASDPMTVTINDSPATPTITATENGTGTTDQACPEQPLTLTATEISGVTYQWNADGGPINGATSSTLTVTGVGDYTVTVTTPSGCSATSAQYTVHNPTPHKAFLTAFGATTFCDGGSVTLWSDSATGIQWYRDGVAIPGAGNESYAATTSGSYTAILNALGCHSQESDPIVVTVNAYPSIPTISATANGTGTSDQACPEQPLTLTATASGATSFQWYSDDAPISGATSSTLVVAARGNYSATATNDAGCTTARSSAYVIDNPTPHKPFVTTSGSTSFCQGGSVTLMSDSATGIQWYRDGVPISGAGSQSYTATASGTYTAILNALGCHSTESDPVVVTVNAYLDMPTISGNDTACPEVPGTLTATSAGATSFQWYADGGPISGATSSTLTVTGAGDYTVTATNAAGCTTTSAVFTVTNPTPHKPTITTSGPTTFCSGNSVTLTSDSATGIQWYLNGSPISGANSQSYVATMSGDYTAILNALGCHSTESDAVTVIVNANPSAAITAPPVVISSSTGNSASVTNAGNGATYSWSITNGTITSGNGTNAITFTAGTSGTLTLQATVTTSSGCSDTQSASVSAVDPVMVTNVTPSSGASAGGTSVTIKGTGFLTGATVTFGGSAATNVVVVSSTRITATTPAHATGDVDVVVTNNNSASGTLTSGFRYKKK